MAYEKRDQFNRNQREGVQGTPQPAKAKGFAAKWSDLGPSKTNPTGIWSPAYIALKQALDNGADPDTVLAALRAWLDNKTQRGISQSELDRILDLPTKEHAYRALIDLIGGKMNPEVLPPAVQQTVHRAIQRLAQDHIARGEQDIAKASNRLQGLRGRYGVESATAVVRSLLAS